MTAKIFEHKNLIANLPGEVKKIFHIFNSSKPDYIRLVGGCVRDLLLEKQIKDFDFATKFLPEQTIEILEENGVKAIPTGVKYGTITAVLNHKHFEITTLRKDIKNDGRHPITEFVDDYFFDAARRDFTINALYFDEDGKIHDYFEGIPDLKNKKVKFIGDPNSRIQEDYLRILRFFRFSISYTQKLDEKGLEACIKNKKGLEILSADRIRTEFFKFFENSNKEKLLTTLKIIEENKIREEIFSTEFQINNLEKFLNLEENLNLNSSDILKFAALIFSENLNLKEVFSKLNFSNSDKKHFIFLFNRFFDNSQTLDTKALKELLVFEKKEFVQDFYLLKASQNEILDLKRIKQDLDFITNFSLPEFPVNGEDLLKLGFSGVEIGEILAKMKEIWIESDFESKKDDLIKRVLK